MMGTRNVVRLVIIMVMIHAKYVILNVKHVAIQILKNVSHVLQILF
jgi:hypothetical protein